MVLRFVSLAAVTIVWTSIASAQDSFRVDGLQPGDSLSIRETPDAGAPNLGQAPMGARLRGFGCTADTPSGMTWCRVKAGPILGWARRRYLAPD